jgi:hypothetical protein
MGGGVALSLVHLDPERIASLTLLSAIGVQDMELLGEYHVNHIVHAVQLGGLWVLSRGIPHLGALDAPWPYVRNFFDSDQRPLRAVLENVDVPTLIVHGRADPLVPVEAAVEHARLVPQSELRVLEESHFMVFGDARRMGAIIVDFLERVDRGQAPSRTQAGASRMAAAARPHDPRVVPRARAVNAGVLGGVLAAATVVSAGIGPVAAGVLVSQGRAGAVLALLSCLLGTFAARSAHRSASIARRAALDAVVRVALGAVAGAAILSTPLLAAAGAWTRATVVTGMVAAALWIVASCATYRRRRLLYSSWLRLTRWEYWPPLVSYLPVAGYVLWLMVRHRSATVFTAANPSILAGGFIGESKIDILNGLAASGSRVARSALIDGTLTTEGKMIKADAFLAAAQPGLPVVLKPNEGQRGSGVVVARTKDALAACLVRSSVDTVIQEYVPGLEFGVFYVRRPSEARGHILSITEKRLPSVTGDGRRTVEELLLQDRDTIGMARFHLRQQSGRLRDVPQAGERMMLGDCGSHCRGARFYDGRRVLTPLLEAAFDDIARTYEGFYFGRFDVRACSLDDFRRGQGFKVIELNGVTSEATHIYDPAISLRRAYRALFEQWRLAFEIGAANAKRGAQVTSMWALVRLLIHYREASKGHLASA